MPVWILQEVITAKMDRREAKALARAMCFVSRSGLKAGGCSEEEIRTFYDFHGALMDATKAPTSTPTAMTIPADHPESTCQKCGGPNVCWHAPSETWNRVATPDRYVIWCPLCFIAASEAIGIASFLVMPDPILYPPHSTGSGQ